MSNASAGEEEEIQNHELDMNRMVQVAQVCHFCTVFRQPLKLPAFTRQVIMISF
jgi:hypothetical protein